MFTGAATVSSVLDENKSFGESHVRENSILGATGNGMFHFNQESGANSLDFNHILSGSSFESATLAPIDGNGLTEIVFANSNFTTPGIVELDVTTLPPDYDEVFI